MILTTFLYNFRDEYRSKSQMEALVHNQSNRYTMFTYYPRHIPFAGVTGEGVDPPPPPIENPLGSVFAQFV